MQILTIKQTSARESLLPSRHYSLSMTTVTSSKCSQDCQRDVLGQLDAGGFMQLLSNTKVNLSQPLPPQLIRNHLQATSVCKQLFILGQKSVHYNYNCSM